MNKLLILPLFCFLCISCTDVEPEEEPVETPVKPPVVKPQPKPKLPVQNYDPTAAFLTPTTDRTLPSEAQLEDGADLSMGAGVPGAIVPETQPTTTIKPPSSDLGPTLADDLAPAE